MRWLADLLRGGSDELGWDDLIRRSAQAIAKLARHGERGRVAFPDVVVVRVSVGEGSVGPVRAFVEDPALDRAVGAALANECDCDADVLPHREYEVIAAATTSVAAVEGAPRSWELVVEGGDLGGRLLPVPAGARELRFGRGPWHGADRSLPNDLVVCESTGFVSRKAGRILASGRTLEVEALDQGDALAVVRADGSTIRPARTAKGSVSLRDGDAIVLADAVAGGARDAAEERAVRLVLRGRRGGGERDGADA